MATNAQKAKSAAHAAKVGKAPASSSSSSSKSSSVAVPSWAKGSQYDTGLSVATQQALSRASTDKSKPAANIYNTPSALDAPEEEAPTLPSPTPIVEEPIPAEDSIATGQPNPATATAQPFTNPDGTVAAGGQGSTGQGTAPISSKNQGFLDATAAGAVAPTSGAAGSALVSQYAPDKPTNPGSMFVAQDPYIESLVSAWQAYIAPASQRESLTSTYQKLLKKSGIEALDTQIMNTKAIMEGSESDIRREAVASQGLITDSQVMALSAARNREILKTYNVLVETRNAKASYLNTAIQLEQQDRQAADQRFENAFEMGTKIFDMTQQMKRNTAEAYDRVISAVGYDGLSDMTQGDQYATSVVERSLGLPSGGLGIAANQARQQRAFATQEQQLGIQGKQLDLQLKGEQIKTQQAQRSKIYNDMQPGGAVTIDPKTGQRIVQPIAQNSLPDLLLQYRNKVEDSTKFGRIFNPNTTGELDSLRSQITAVYKQEQKLGTLDAGVQKLIDGIIGGSPGKGLFNLGGITTFLNPLNSQNQGAILKKVDNFLTNQSGIDLSKKNDLKGQMQKGEIMVLDRNTRQIGAIPEVEFDSSIYIKI